MASFVSFKLYQMNKFIDLTVNESVISFKLMAILKKKDKKKPQGKQ